LGDRKGIRPIKKVGFGRFAGGCFDWSFAGLNTEVVITTSIIFSFNKTG